jgi:hypothetical protein
MPLTDHEAALLGQWAKVHTDAQTQMRAEIDALKAERATTEFLRESNAAHGHLRDRGYSPQQIAKGEERMAREHTANYGHAERLGLFGEPKLVVGGMDLDTLKHAMENPYDERFWDEHTRNVLSEDR